jgi:hypothetical protein
MGIGGSVDVGSCKGVGAALMTKCGAGTREGKGLGLRKDFLGMRGGTFQRREEVWRS